MAGYPLTKSTLDQAFGEAVLNLALAFTRIHQVKAMLDDPARITDEKLTELGYEAGEITSVRAAFSALTSLDAIGHAQATQPAANDFWWDAKLLFGVRGPF